MIKKLLAFSVVTLLATQFISAQAPIPNGDFENWASGNPVSWGSSDKVITQLFQPDPGGVEQDTSVYFSGHSSVRLTNKQINIPGVGNQVIPGVVNLGNISLNFQTLSPEITGYAYTDRPDSIVFAAKFTKAVGSVDTGGVSISLTKFSNGQRLIIANVITRVADQANFQVFKSKIRYYSAQTPDTLLIQGLSTLSQTGTEGSVMWLDSMVVNGLDTAFKAYIVPFASRNVCQGDTVNFRTDDISGNTYQWYKDGTLLTGQVAPQFDATANGSYFVQVVSNATTYTSDTITITYAPNPTVTLTLPVDTFCSTTGAQALSGGSPAGGDFSGDAVNNNEFDPSTAGVGTHTIQYVYVDNNGCGANATQNVVVKTCVTGIETVEAGWSVNIYPNPANNLLVIETDQKMNGGTFEAYDMQGRLVMKQTITNTKLDLSVKNLAEGTYSIRIVNAAKVAVANAKVSVAH